MTFSYFIITQKIKENLKPFSRIYLLWWLLGRPLTDQITLPGKSNICSCQHFIRFQRIYCERRWNVWHFALWKLSLGFWAMRSHPEASTIGFFQLFIFQQFSSFRLCCSFSIHSVSWMTNMKWNFCDSSRLCGEWRKKFLSWHIFHFCPHFQVRDL